MASFILHSEKEHERHRQILEQQRGNDNEKIHALATALLKKVEQQTKQIETLTTTLEQTNMTLEQTNKQVNTLLVTVEQLGKQVSLLEQSFYN